MSRRGIKHIGLSANNLERKEMTAPAVISFYKPMGGAVHPAREKEADA